MAKVRYKYVKIQFSNCYKTSLEEKEKYRKACVITKVLDGIRVSEKALEITSDDPELLLETSHRQQISMGRTNICDDLFQFFLKVCDLENLLDKNLILHRSDTFTCLIFFTIMVLHKFVHFGTNRWH